MRRICYTLIYRRLKGLLSQCITPMVSIGAIFCLRVVSQLLDLVRVNIKYNGGMSMVIMMVGAFLDILVAVGANIVTSGAMPP